MACGTGASAAVVAGLRKGLLEGHKGVVVDLPGGTLTVTVARDSSDVILSGPAVKVFEGFIEPSENPSFSRR
jgi:diaminopimelate epimerase